MKKIILGFCFLGFLSCKSEQTRTVLGKVGVDTTYHIKAKHLHDCYWGVVFTNTNFYTEEPIMHTFDVSWGTGDNKVSYFELWFNSKLEAVDFALKMKTYADCRRYNDSVENVYHNLQDFRDKNPIIKMDAPVKNDPCKDEKGKEILIY